MIVVDTNVVSELMRLRPSAEVKNWFERHILTEFAVTAITIAEVFYGVELLPRGKRKSSLLAEAEAMFQKDFRRILAFDSLAARAYPGIAAARRSSGRPISREDAQIAAIVSVHGAILATRNDKDFEHCGIPVINPWNPR